MGKSHKQGLRKKTQMSAKYVKRHPTATVIRIKHHVTPRFTLSYLQKIYTSNKNQYSNNTEQSGFRQWWWERKLAPLWNTVWRDTIWMRCPQLINFPHRSISCRRLLTQVQECSWHSTHTNTHITNTTLSTDGINTLW